MSRLNTLLALAFTSSIATVPARAAPEQDQSCLYDKAAMLQLDTTRFDQDDTLGWRKIGNLAHCKIDAANLIDMYIRRHHAELSRKWLISSFRWHEGQLRALAGDTKGAIRTMHQAIKPETGPAEVTLWAEYALPWNDYVNATISFLRRDPTGLKRSRDKLAASPMPSDYAEIDLSLTRGMPLLWPENLNIVDRLIACYDHSYEDAYYSTECQAKPAP